MADLSAIRSLLDTDLYKLTMQFAVFQHFPKTKVSYKFNNRTADKLFSRSAYRWLETQIEMLGDLTVSTEEIDYLRKACPYLNNEYLRFLQAFHLRPSEQITTTFIPQSDKESDTDVGHIDIGVEGLWVDTILFEIPLLALASEAYFKFCDQDWTYDGQVEQAHAKALQLLEHGCLFSEFGTRRRRDYHTQELVIQGLCEAAEKGSTRGLTGKLSGTSNIHFAMRFGIPCVGTVAHEWYMGIASLTNDYVNATQVALDLWLTTFGRGVLGIALTDTFGTESFLKTFAKQSSDSSNKSSTNEHETYADLFTGTRQDSGDPLEFVRVMRKFYDDVGMLDKKTIVFSDSLNVRKCIEYKNAADKAGFQPSFGVGTFFTNDFKQASTGDISVPLNIVIKLASADGNPAIKISDNAGKNSGDSAVLAKAKKELGYHEKSWADGDEGSRWGK